jgi:Spy/CpxP family protein refolding chaperone
MKTIGKYLGAFLVVVALISSVNTASAQRHGDSQCGQHIGKKGHKMCEMLGLTGTQKTSIDNIKLRVDKKVLVIDNKLGELRAKKRTLMTSENIDRKAVENNIKAMSNLREKKQILRANQMIDIRKTLTPKQKLMFDKHHSRKSCKEGRKGNHKAGHKGHGRSCKH